MKHEIKIVNTDAESMHQSLGVADDAFEGMVDNLTLEIFHAKLFRGDKRDLPTCLTDVLDNLEPAEFGIEPKTANDYVLIGMALAKAMELNSAMYKGVRDHAKDSLGGLPGLNHILEKLTEMKESSSIETKGSLN